MKTVKAPNGYEGCRFYCDGSRGWKISAKPQGATWWTVVGIIGIIGHAYTPEAELEAAAEACIISAVNLGRVS